MGTVPPEFVEKWRAFGGHLATMSPWAVLVSVLTLAIIVAWPRFNRRIPSPFVALIVTTALVQLLHLPVETIGTRFGVINAALPRPALPAITLAQLPALMGPAFTIALLGAVRSEERRVGKECRPRGPQGWQRTIRREHTRRARSSHARNT